MMKKSAFFDFLNVAHNGDYDELVEFGVEDRDYINWNEFLLPMDYGDAEKEYWAIRRSCALFDVSPIRKIRITGPAAGELLDYVLTRPVSAADDMRGIYVAYCHQDGNIKDDSILYKFAHDDYLLMPSDIDHSGHLQSFREFLAISPQDLTITECTDDWHGVAIQGPLSSSVLGSMGFDQIADLKPFEVRYYEISGSTIVVARMGFTADLGYEIWFEPAFTEVFQGLIQAARQTNNLEIPGYGLTALEACRLEGAFIVAGWDFSTEADPDPDFSRTPFEVGLGWLVDLKGQDFVGRSALIDQKAKGQKFVLRQFEIDANCPIEDGCAVYVIVDGEDKKIGSINCSAWSWGLNKMIGNVSIQRGYSDRSEASILLQDVPYRLVLTRGPLVHLARRSQVPAADK
jgi:aminomethyltransferase